MPLSVWTQPSGYSFGTINERQTVNLPLPVTTATGIHFSIISGKLPSGLRINNGSIVGTPLEVSRTTEFRFVIRASNETNFADRTYKISVEGSDEPNWLTPAGPLPIGSNQAYYIIDSSFIDFNLSATDADTAAGQNLNFFIASGEGELPPGLILMPNGRITGFIQPLLAVPLDAGDGGYGTDLYDRVAYDFGYRPSNGYDTYVYDSVTYGFSVPTGRPKKLNRNYEFIVTITDGDAITKRKFRIFVVGDDFFRADNVVMQAGTGVYTADVTYVRAPIFTTPSYLGLRRANNYQTFKIDIYEGTTDLGPVFYSLDKVNAVMNGVTQREVSTDNRQGSTSIRLERLSGVPQINQKINFFEEFLEATDQTYTITEVDQLGGDIYRLTVMPALEVTIPNGVGIYVGDDSILPPGMSFDSLTSEVYGTIPYQPAVTKNYRFTIKAKRLGQGTEISISRRLFTVDILGEIESAMSWISPEDLGSIDAGYVSNEYIKATSTYASNIVYYLDSGKLPPGLSLNLDGELVGKINQATSTTVYRSFWKPSSAYNENSIVKRNNEKNIKSLLRRKNTASIVTETDHGFKTGQLIKVQSDSLSFNQYSGIEIDVPKFKILSTSIEGNTVEKFRLTLTIDTQKSAPLAPVFTLIKGNAVSTAAGFYYNVPVKSTSGNGSGAVFHVKKLANLTTATYVGVTTVTLVNPGSGYLPGDTITISGSVLGGLDGVNDMTFVTSSGLEFYYKLNGNSNSNYNGRFFATKSTTNSITLHFNSNPGTFGPGLISVETSPGAYEAQTQITSLNYFNYYNKNATASHKSATGLCIGQPVYYIAKETHVSNANFSNDSAKWQLYSFPIEDQFVTTYDGNITTFDSTTTTNDRVYTFTITAKDSLNYSAITRTFTLSVNIPNEKNYSNIFARPFLKTDQRALFKDFITDSNVFDPKLIYRSNDKNFGVQRELKMLVFAGIETAQAVEYISAMGRNHKPKRFRLGSVKKAVAKESGTNDILYEVVYIEVVDPLEKGKKYLPDAIRTSSSNVNITVDQTNEFYRGPFTSDNQFWSRPIPFHASLDRTDVFVGDSGTLWKFPSSISIWRKRIRNIANRSRERNYLPLWMRSIQENSVQELDYVAAVPLCYCKPGTADDILLNIKNSGFDFKLLDYTIDRYIIDAVEGYYADKYLVFRNDRTTIT